MPARDLVSLRDALEQRFRARRKRQTNRSTVLLNVLTKTSVRGRKNYATRISSGSAVGQVFSDGQDFTEFQRDDEHPLILNHGQYGDTFQLTHRAEDAAAGDPGDYANLFMADAITAANRAAARINLDLWAGPGTSGPQRLHGITSPGGPIDATGTYGGIDRSLRPEWGGNRFTNAGTPRAFTIALLEAAIDGTYEASGHTPNLIVTTPTIWRIYKRLAKQDALERIILNGREIKLDAGAQALEIDGVPILKDKDCPAGTVAGLSTDCIGVERLMPAQSRIDRELMAVNLPIAGTPEDQYATPDDPEANPLGGEMYMLSKTGNHSKYAIECTIVLWSDRSNAHFWLDDIQ